MFRNARPGGLASLFILSLLLSASSSIPATVSAAPPTAGTYTALTCNRSDVNAVINGPTHIAVDGDVIQIPSGSCTWTSGVTVPIGIGITIIGSGSPASTPSTRGADASCTATQIIHNAGRNSLFIFQPTVGNVTTRLSCIDFSAQPGLGPASIGPPVVIEGTCSTSSPYCPNIRVDNLTFDGSFQGVVDPSSTMTVVGDVFGVMDHNSLPGGSRPGSGGREFVNFNNGSWQGVGLWGDNSWSSPDTYGTFQVLYVENNTFGTGIVIAETEASPPTSGGGGGRIVVRFNDCTGCVSGVANHGTESNGRPRSGRQLESYGNNFNCIDTLQGCPSGFALRGGTGIEFGNTFTVASGASYNVTWAGGVYSATINAAGARYAVGTLSIVAGNDARIGGTSPTNDLKITVTSVDGSGAVTGVSTAGSPFPSGTAPAGTGSINALAAGNAWWSSYMTFLVGRIGLNFPPFGVCDGAGAYDHNDGVVYYTGTMSGVTMSGSSTTFADSMGQTFPDLIPTGAPYAVHDASQTNVGAFISSNTSTTITVLNTGTGGNTNPPPFVNGDTYQVVRASACLDQPGRSGGTLFNLDTNPTHPPTPTNASGGWVYQTLDPLYEWNDSGYRSVSAQIYGKNVTPGPNTPYAPQLIENRDWYSDNSQGNPHAQTSPSSPFDGSKGVGFGTLANRPSTCTAGVGYFVTDQGNWNSSGNPFGQGQLFVCSATNTWTLHYTPYTYPHPVTTSTSTQSTSGSTAPAITTQPASQTISGGSTATLSVVASGTAPLSYQWYQGPSGTPVGTNSSSFTTRALATTTSYWVTVTNGAGSVSSAAATITVNTAVAPTVTITIQHFYQY